MCELQKSFAAPRRMITISTFSWISQIRQINFQLYGIHFLDLYTNNHWITTCLYFFRFGWLKYFFSHRLFLPTFLRFAKINRFYWFGTKSSYLTQFPKKFPLHAGFFKAKRKLWLLGISFCLRKIVVTSHFGWLKFWSFIFKIVIFNAI